MEINRANQEFYQTNPNAVIALGAYALYKEVTEPPHSIKGWERFVQERIDDEEI